MEPGREPTTSGVHHRLLLWAMYNLYNIQIGPASIHPLSSTSPPTKPCIRNNKSFPVNSLSTAYLIGILSYRFLIWDTDGIVDKSAEFKLNREKIDLFPNPVHKRPGTKMLRFKNTVPTVCPQRKWGAYCRASGYLKHLNQNWVQCYE